MDGVFDRPDLSTASPAEEDRDRTAAAVPNGSHAGGPHADFTQKQLFSDDETTPQQVP